MQPYDAKAIANEFLDIAQRHGESLTPMKLQKLVYFAHGWNLGINDSPLINEEVEAWRYGPVIPSLYQEFKAFGGSPIEGRATSGYPLKVARLENTTGNDHAYTRRLLDWVWRKYGAFTPAQLSSMTHAPETPWKKAWDSMGKYYLYGVDINRNDIKEHFAAQLAKSKNGASA